METLVENGICVESFRRTGDILKYPYFAEDFGYTTIPDEEMRLWKEFLPTESRGNFVSTLEQLREMDAPASVISTLEEAYKTGIFHTFVIRTPEEENLLSKMWVYFKNDPYLGAISSFNEKEYPLARWGKALLSLEQVKKFLYSREKTEKFVANLIMFFSTCLLGSFFFWLFNEPGWNPLIWTGLALIIYPILVATMINFSSSLDKIFNYFPWEVPFAFFFFGAIFYIAGMFWGIISFLFSSANLYHLSLPSSFIVFLLLWKIIFRVPSAK